MKKIFLVYGHYNKKSFNSAIKDTFINTAEKNGNEVTCVDLYQEKFNPVFAGEKPDNVVIDHQKKIEVITTLILTGLVFKEYEENYDQENASAGRGAKQNGHFRTS